MRLACDRINMAFSTGMVPMEEVVGCGWYGYADRGGKIADMLQQAVETELR
jgi:hypothetical protein